MIKIFLYLHVVGIIALVGGIFAYLYPDNGLKSTGAMVGIASAIGLGLLLISPYPVVKAIQWMMNENSSNHNGTDKS